MVRAPDSSPGEFGEHTSAAVGVAAAVQCDGSRCEGSPLSSDKTSELRSLVERLERALERAPTTIAAIAAGTAEFEKHQETLKQHFVGLERTCAGAEEVQLGLSEFVEQLTEVSDASQEKISLLMDGLDAANQARHELKEAARDFADLAARTESRTGDQEKRLGEAAETHLAKMKGMHETHLAELKRVSRQALEQFGAKGEHTLRLTELIERGVSTINRETDRKERRLGETVEGQAARFESAARDHEQRLASLADRCTAAVSETQSKTVVDLKAALEHELAPFRAGGEQAQRLAELIDRGVGSIKRAETQGARGLDEAVNTHITTFNGLADAKIKQLVSQLQASREAVRMVSESTREAQGTLSRLSEKREAAESQVREMDERSKKMSAAVARLDELHAKTEPAVAAIEACMEGSEATVNKIEQLIQEVWTVTATAQKRGHQVRERSKEATQVVEALQAERAEGESCVSSLAEGHVDARRQLEELSSATTTAGVFVEQINAAVINASGVSERITGETDSAGELVCDLGALTERAEKTMEQMEIICDSASKLASETVQGVQRADAANAHLAESTSRAEDTATVLATAVDEADAAVESVTGVSQSATEAVRELESRTADQEALAGELRSRIEAGSAMAQDLAGTLAAGSKLQETLASTTSDANDASREVAEILADIADRRKLLETSGQTMSNLIDHAEALQVKWRQLETRAEAFGHQLDGMLSHPTKIVEEAKTQAGQLDRVCKAVRKVFSGLSQTSLQANRDIARFGQISREATGRLGQISADTRRATQTLREWVDEAAHVQSRLSRSLAQVPAIGQTHPTAALEDLGRLSEESLPDVLKPEAGEPSLLERGSPIPRSPSRFPRPEDLGHSPPAPQGPHRLGQGVNTPEPEQRQSPEDLAALIRQAEQAAEANQ